MNDKNAVVLLSGGLDSSTTAAIARDSGYLLNCLTFDYGQRHAHELNSARAVAAYLNAGKHLTLKIELDKIGGSALTDNIKVPKNRDAAGIERCIPITYVPARNTIFLSYALAYAEVSGAEHIFIGINSVDYSGYPDCRPEYIRAFEQMASLALKKTVEGTMSVKIHTPLIEMTKAEIIKKGVELGMDFSLTYSCYDPSPEGLACGRCDSCMLRLKGFEEAGFKDPLKYRD
ncbi:MAG: 7-cyano-7-deazaguanine synthase QueC [candidate division Zixibacteria bacterium]|nr:7-cyano-7-deazaguanine synthase QueC [candidate division Zixibacteria bacterium]